MALYVSWRFTWFFLFCVVFLGLGVGLSYPGKRHSKYVVGSVFYCWKCRLGVTGCVISKFTMYHFMYEVRESAVISVCKGKCVEHSTTW
jgi:hypothetical protein